MRMARNLYAAVAMTGFLSPAIAAEDPSPLELVRDCDLLAAHPDDPQRMAEGVSDDKIVPRLAIAACQQALKGPTPDPRFAFQLGRALLSIGKKKEAAQQFLAAANNGYAAAWAYLGDAYQFGHDGPADNAKAFEAYGKALDGGFERARPLLEALSFDETIFSNNIIEIVYNNDLRQLNLKTDSSTTRLNTRTYIFSFLQKSVSECDKILEPKNIRSMFVLRYGKNTGSEEETPEQALSATADSAAAEFDAQTFIKRHGCEGPVSKQVFANINSFLSGR